MKSKAVECDQSQTSGASKVLSRKQNELPGPLLRDYAYVASTPFVVSNPCFPFFPRLAWLLLSNSVNYVRAGIAENSFQMVHWM